MLQSQRDTTRLCQKFTEPRRARPFDSYSQDELRFRMMEMDGCNGRLPSMQGHNGGGTPMREIAAKNRKIVMDYLRANPKCQSREIADANGWSTHRVSGYLSDLKMQGKATNIIGGKATRKWVAI